MPIFPLLSRIETFLIAIFDFLVYEQQREEPSILLLLFALPNNSARADRGPATLIAGSGQRKGY